MGLTNFEKVRKYNKMQEISPKLTPKKTKAIAALLDNSTIQEAAARAGVNPATLHRWLDDHDFKKAFRTANQKIVVHAISRIQNASGKAVDALIDIIDDSKNPPSTRASAAKTILEMTTKSIEIEDLQARLDKIEEILRRQEGGK